LFLISILIYTVHIGKTSDTVPVQKFLKKGDALAPLPFNSVSGYGIMKVQETQDALKLKGTHHLLVYARDDNL
jgi:hypothetical protein